MSTLLPFVIGTLFAVSFYLLLRRSMVKVILGLMLLGQGINLLIFTSAGLDSAQPPVIPGSVETLAAPHADPLPQALILTAIVISFGILAFALALMRKAHETLKTDDLDQMREEEE